MIYDIVDTEFSTCVGQLAWDMKRYVNYEEHHRGASFYLGNKWFFKASIPFELGLIWIDFVRFFFAASWASIRNFVSETDFRVFPGSEGSFQSCTIFLGENNWHQLMQLINDVVWTLLCVLVFDSAFIHWSWKGETSTLQTKCYR